MKKNILVLAVLMLFGNYAFSQESLGLAKKQKVAVPIYDFVVKDISGNDFDFKKLQGKRILIVNTASECGYTPQYAELEKLYKQYEKSLVVVGFPANDFKNQEPGSDSDIVAFCQKNYGVTFPMMSKISVIGNEMHPLYKFLTEKSKNGVSDSTVEWNFQKYLIDTNGKLVKVLPPGTSPLDEAIIRWAATGKI